MTISEIEQLEQNLIQTTIVRLRSRVMAMVFGMLGGTGLFVATVWLLARQGRIEKRVVVKDGVVRRAVFRKCDIS